MGTSYQERAWEDNRTRIIKLLSEGPLTFQEVIEKSDLSRGVVNEHLKALEKSGTIKKEYDTKSKRIVNVLQELNLDLVKIFLRQLEIFEVPVELIEAGRKVLTWEIMTFIWNYYMMIWARALTKHPNARILSADRVRIPRIKAEDWTKLPKINPKLLGQDFPWSKDDVKILQATEELKNDFEVDPITVLNILTDPDPYLFHFTLVFFMLDCAAGHIENEALCPVVRWWVGGEVYEFLPSSGFLSLMANLIYKDTSKVPK